MHTGVDLVPAVARESAPRNNDELTASGVGQSWFKSTAVLQRAVNSFVCWVFVSTTLLYTLYD